MSTNPSILFKSWLFGCLMLSLGVPAHAGTVNVTLTETLIFGSTAASGTTFSGTLEVAGYSGTGAGLFEVTGATFELADLVGLPITFDMTDPSQFLLLDGTLFAEFDSSGNLLDFVDDGDSVANDGWGIQSFFYITEAAGTTKYDLFFDNSPGGGSFWTLYPKTKTLGPGQFGLEYGSLFRAGTYETASVTTAVPAGTTAPLLALGLAALIGLRKRRQQG